MESQAIYAEPCKQRALTTLLWQFAACCLPLYPCPHPCCTWLCQPSSPASLAAFLILAAHLLAPSLRAPFQVWKLLTFKLDNEFLEKNEIINLKILSQKRGKRVKQKPKPLFLLIPHAQWAFGRSKESWTGEKKSRRLGEKWQGGKFLMSKCLFL